MSNTRYSKSFVGESALDKSFNPFESVDEPLSSIIEKQK